jgi:hypothetical protein
MAAFATPVLAQSSLTLAWDPSSGSDVAGYNVYYGAASQTYTNTVSAGVATQATLTGMVPGTTYFFAVCAYDSLGLEGPLSTEFSYTVPLVVTSRSPLQIRHGAKGQVLLSGGGQAGKLYNILASGNLTTWMVVGTTTADTNGMVAYAAPLSATNSCCFYRLQAQ